MGTLSTANQILSYQTFYHSDTTWYGMSRTKMTIENFPKIQLKTLRNFMLAFCSRIYMSRCASLVMSYYLDINFSGLDNFLSAIPAAINIARMPARIIQSLHFWQKQAQTTIFEHFKILFKVDTQFKIPKKITRKI